MCAGRSEPSSSKSLRLFTRCEHRTQTVVVLEFELLEVSLRDISFLSSSGLQVPWTHLRNEKMKSEERRGHLKKPDVRVKVGGGGVKSTVAHR